MKKYNPNIHHRRSIRLKGYDYSQAGLYFITICCQDRECRFGKIENDEMILNELGNIAYVEWMKLAERFSNFELDVFQIMPNHMHGIIALKNPVGAGFTPAQNDTNAPNDLAPNDINNQNDGYKGAAARVAPTIGDIVGGFKSLVANGCLDIYKSKNEKMGKFWQRNFHEHIIRNEQSYHRIREYIINNPAKWSDDKFYKI
ncbi:MAG TPA: transposase [Gillisia sp.]|nr:transposase [Gillisia sp.]